MCVCGHTGSWRGMGSSPDTTSHTHPQRAGGEREEETGLHELGGAYSWQAKPNKSSQQA